MREIAQRQQGWPDVLVAPSRAELLQAVGRAQRRGELGAVGLLRCADVGVWSVRVVRVKPARAISPWRRPVLIGGAVALVLVGGAALGWWLVGAVTVAAPLAAGGVALLVLGSRMGRPRGCTTTVTVTHRHH
jgi:hypothetical protein